MIITFHELLILYGEISIFLLSSPFTITKFSSWVLIRALFLLCKCSTPTEEAHYLPGSCLTCHYRYIVNASIKGQSVLFTSSNRSTAEVQQQWLIKQEFNLAASSWFTEAHHHIDLWLINYCHFHYPAEGIRFDTNPWPQGDIFCSASTTTVLFTQTELAWLQ